MSTWIFGYGSLVWRPGFEYKQRLQGYVKGYKRVFYQGSTDHRGVPGAPGRVVTLTEDSKSVAWGAAYELPEDEKKAEILQYLEVREKQYDLRVRADFFTSESEPEPAVKDVLIYVASSDTTRNKNYLGPAPLEEIARQIAGCSGPSGKNSDYIFDLQAHFHEIGLPDPELDELAELVRMYSGLRENAEDEQAMPHNVESV